MSAAWVAAAVRGRGLLDRRLGPERIRQLETAAGIDAAVGLLADSPYGRYVARGMALDEAERAIDATVVWHLRILAGWGPALSAMSIRLLAGRFEIENIEDLLLRFSGQPAPPPFELRAVGLSWSRLQGAGSAGELRQKLAASFWGDPGGEDLGTVRVWLRLVWASEIAGRLPFLRALAARAAAQVVTRLSDSGIVLTGRALDLARGLLGPGSAEPGSSTPEVLWQDEAGWWSQMEEIADRLAASSHPSEPMVVGVALLLAVDAWKARGALEKAAGRDRSGEVRALA